MKKVYTWFGSVSLSWLKATSINRLWVEMRNKHLNSTRYSTLHHTITNDDEMNLRSLWNVNKKTIHSCDVIAMLKSSQCQHSYHPLTHNLFFLLEALISCQQIPWRSHFGISNVKRACAMVGWAKSKGNFPNALSKLAHVSKYWSSRRTLHAISGWRST